MTLLLAAPAAAAPIGLPAPVAADEESCRRWDQVFDLASGRCQDAQGAVVAQRWQAMQRTARGDSPAGAAPDAASAGGAAAGLIAPVSLRGLAKPVPGPGGSAAPPDRSAFSSGYLSFMKPLLVLARSAWAPAPPREVRPTDPARITYHHTDTPTTFTVEDSRRRIRSIYDDHMTRRDGAERWVDIGYNYIVDGAGNVFEGRGAEVQGSHTNDQNPGNVGISLIGDYQALPVPKLQEHAAIQLAGALADEYRMDTSASNFVLGHKENTGARTACPGQRVMDLLPRWRGDVREQVRLIAQAREARPNDFVALAVVNSLHEPASRLASR